MALGGVALDIGLSVARKGAKYAYDVYKGTDINNLGVAVNGLSPTFDEMYELTIHSPSEAWVRNLNDKLIEGKVLVQNSAKTPILKKFGEAKKGKELLGDINNSMQNVVLANVALNQIKLRIAGEDMKNSFSMLLQLLNNLASNQETLREDIKIDFSTQQKALHEDIVSCFSTQQETLREDIDNAHKKLKEELLSKEDLDRCLPPDMPDCLLGFDEYVKRLKEIVLKEEVDVVGVTAIGGAGKSALATALCHHTQIKDYFKEIIYIVVSQRPDLLRILKTMWRNIVGGPEPDFTNAEDAHNKLRLQIKSRRNEPILVVLDDIWEFSDLERLLFKGEHYRTVVTSRDTKTIQSIKPWFKKRIYELPCLEEEHALSLFCLCAFDMSTIPDTHSEQLVKQVQAECKRLPLALQVIGSSLNGEPDSVWKATRDALARGEAADDNQIIVLLKRLETSIDVLNPGEKQCFLDLAVFPRGRIIPANVLLDIWVYVRRMRRNDAVQRLRKFAARHLLDLKRDPWTTGITDDCMNSYSFTQHDVMRQLALFLAEQDNETHFRRLYMPQKQSEFPPEWQTGGDHSSRAQIVSIHTGAINDTQWPEMEFPEAEALVLYITASEYCIPTFLNSMRKLKVLIIHNDRAKRAKLSGLAAFQELSQLKTLHLERVIVPPLHEDCKGLKSLQKIYLSLCEGLGKDKMFNLPALLEFNVDHCSDLEELSAGICSSNSLEALSITHCHSLAKLPDDLGKLGSLKEIRLCQSPDLKALPTAICSLGKLELLDISSCMGLKVDRRKDSELKKTLKSLAQLATLEKVICDEDNKQLFTRPGLKVEAVKEEFTLNWLN